MSAFVILVKFNEDNNGPICKLTKIKIKML